MRVPLLHSQTQADTLLCGSGFGPHSPRVARLTSAATQLLRIGGGQPSGNVAQCRGAAIHLSWACVRCPAHGQTAAHGCNEPRSAANHRPRKNNKRRAVTQAATFALLPPLTDILWPTDAAEKHVTILLACGAYRKIVFIPISMGYDEAARGVWVGHNSG